MESTDRSSTPPTPSPWRFRVAAVGIAIAVTGLAAVVLRTMPVSQRYYTDADRIREPEASARTRDVLWQPARPLDEIINTASDDYEPRLSADGMTLFFVRGKAGGGADIYQANRSPTGWSEPQALAEMNSEHDDLGPEPSADGESLYFYSDRPDGLGGYDIWCAQRTATGWRAAVNVGPAVNSPFNDYGPALSPDGLLLYFSSNRPQPTDTDGPKPNAWPATLREDLYQRDYDLYAASVTPQGFAPAQALSALNTPYNEGAAAVSSFGDFLYFGSDRPGGSGGFDIYRTRRLRGEHTQAENLGPAVNSAANELDPGLALGGYALYFSSDRTEFMASPTPSASPATGQAATPEPRREYNLYYTTSREVFSETERIQRPPIDWAALWSQIGPNLWWALLALLLLLLLLALMRPLPDRQMSLLTKCLLASLMAHLLLMLLFNVWQVTAALAGEFRRGGPIRVSIASRAAGGELFAQLGGNLTAIEAPATPSIDDIRQAPALEVRPLELTPQTEAEPLRMPTPRRFETHTLPAEATPSPQAPPSSPAASVPDVASLVSAPIPTLRLPAEETRTPVAEPTLPAPSELRPPQRTERAAAVPPPTVTRRELADIAPAPDSRGVIAAMSTPVMAVNAEPPVDATPPPIAANSFSLRSTASPPLALPLPELALASLPVERTSEIVDTEPALTAPMIDATSLPGVRAATATPVTVEPRSAWREMPVAASGSIPTADRSFITDTPVAVADASPAAPAPSPSVAPTPIPSSAGTTGAASIAVSPLEEHRGGSPAAEAALPQITLAAPGMSARANLQPALSKRTPTPAMIASDMLPRGTKHVPDPPSSGFRSAASVTDAKPIAIATAPVPAAAPVLASARPIQPATRPDLDLPLPTETAPVENPYAQRSADDRMSIVKRMGGSDDTEKAVADALRWLAEHQNGDGWWDGRGFDDRCGKCGGQTDVESDHALTGLALLAFLGAGHTHATDGPYRDNVARALRRLLEAQRSDGDLRGQETMYSHGIAAIALSEAYGMTRDAELAGPVRRAADFIERARNRRAGGWRYDPGQAGDTSVLGWQVMALKSAHLNGIPVAAESFQAARAWLDSVETPGKPGRYSYKAGRAATVSMTAEGMFVQQLLGRRREEARMQNSAAFLMTQLPDWNTQPNTYYWYYATLALFQHQGESWKRWNEALTRELLAHQRKDGPAAGSWDPHGEWADVGGRVYQTALCTLMLEVYYRYLPLYLIEQPRESIGIIRGEVTDASSRSPLPGASVKVDLADGEPVSATTGPDGRYELRVPQVPDFFAATASHDGFVAGSRNVDAAMVRGGTLTLDFALQPENDAIVAVEAVPDVHHLGDNHFDGTINSQFQKTSEGSEYEAEFTLKESQVPPYVRGAEVQLLAKGVQRRHRIRINGTALEKRLSEAPEDGSFGEFAAPFDASLLREGTNTLEVIAAPSDSDIDDFEFVNVRIVLTP